MKIRLICFTDKGHALCAALKGSLTDHAAEIFFRSAELSSVCGDAFERREPLVFVCAAGIAVRTVAPFVKDKLSDPPVLVIDELGGFVIPILSGHAGGANELALEIAEALEAVPVITTATDINGAFPVDVFARENGLSILNREGIAKVSSKALRDRPVTISVKDYPPAEPVDVLITDDIEVLPGDPEPDASAACADTKDRTGEAFLRDAASIVLCPKRYALGMGCRRGKSFEELRDFALKLLDENGISLRDVGCIATIDIKKDEEGLRALSQAWRMPLITFDAGVLARAGGEFSSSETVLEKVGVDNVCERAAVTAAGTGSKLVIRRTAGNGMTAALASVKAE